MFLLGYKYHEMPAEEAINKVIESITKLLEYLKRLPKFHNRTTTIFYYNY